MSVLTTIENTADSIASLMGDVSKYAPAPISTVAALIGVASKAVAFVLHAADGHPNPTDPLAVLETAIRLASDAAITVELPP